MLLPCDLSPLAAFVNLNTLDLLYNDISDVASLLALDNLSELGLGYNAISDVGPLAGLSNLTSLHLRGNAIGDWGPLVSNTGLGSGDVLELRGNPLDREALCSGIPELRARGVTITHDGSCWGR